VADVEAAGGRHRALDSNAAAKAGDDRAASDRAARKEKLVAADKLAAPPAASPTNWQPTWSPDGKWIAYASNREGSFEIWKSDGVHVRRIARDGSLPAWSPDGARVAFTRDGGGISLVGKAGGAVRPLTSEQYGLEPSWSPDGRRIAFTRPGGCGDGFAIEVMRSDGRNEEQVSGSSEFEAHTAPAWAPDGRKIAYVHNAYVGESVTLHWTFPDSNTYDYVEPQLLKGKRPGRPSWSPDGRYLVFADDRTSKNLYSTPTGFGPLYVLDLQKHRLRRLTRMAATTPSWSPRGKRIAFAAKTPVGTVELYLIDPDGSDLVRLSRQ